MNKFKASMLLLLVLVAMSPWVWASQRWVFDTDRGEIRTTNRAWSMDLNAKNDWSFKGGGVSLDTLGKGLSIKEGSNAKMGVATLVSGWVTVASTATKSTSRIFVTGQTSTGACYVKSRVANTSFSIYSIDTSDSGTAAWMIADPSP